MHQCWLCLQFVGVQRREHDGPVQLGDLLRSDAASHPSRPGPGESPSRLLPPCISVLRFSPSLLSSPNFAPLPSKSQPFPSLLPLSSSLTLPCCPHPALFPLPSVLPCPDLLAACPVQLFPSSLSTFFSRSLLPSCTPVQPA